MRELAAEENVPLIDLAAKSKDLLNNWDPKGRSQCSCGLRPGEFINFVDGTEDNTHFQEQGALVVAKLVLEGMKELPFTASHTLFALKM